MKYTFATNKDWIYISIAIIIALALHVRSLIMHK